MKVDAYSPCPCSSGLNYQDCCQPFHLGKSPDNALLLMRSRFSAYALNLPDYIIKTTHPKCPEYSDNTIAWKEQISLFSTRTSFDKLEIWNFHEEGSFATVTFTAYLTQGDDDCTFTEKSDFELCNGQWLYRAGKVTPGCDFCHRS